MSFWVYRRCFNANIYPSRTKLGFQVTLRFRLTQNIRDKQLLINLKNYFNCGFVSFSNNSGVFVVVKIEDIVNVIIPHFEKYLLPGIKHNDFLDFCKIAELVKQKDHITQPGLDKIELLIKGMNTGRNNISESSIGFVLLLSLTLCL